MRPGISMQISASRPPVAAVPIAKQTALFFYVTNTAQDSAESDRVYGGWANCQTPTVFPHHAYEIALTMACTLEQPVDCN